LFSQFEKWRQEGMEMTAKPFTINIPQGTLDDLRERLAKTRWMDEVEGAGWNYGTSLAYLKELVRYWHDEFDWRAQEAIINRSAHFRADVDGLGFISFTSAARAKIPCQLF
jgi:hypothetical protein